MSRKLSYLLASLSLITLSACQSKVNNHPQDTLRVDIGGDVTSFDPQKMVDSYTFRVLSQSSDSRYGAKLANFSRWQNLSFSIA